MQENPENVKPQVKEIYKKAEQFLEKPFSFYTINLQLNED